MRALIFSISALFFISTSTFSINQKDSLLALHYSEKADPSTYSLLAATYYETNVDSGAYFADLALVYALHTNNNVFIGEAYYQKADSYYYKGDLDSTLFYYLNSLDYYLKTDKNNEIAGVYNDIGNILQTKSFIDSALVLFNLSLQYIDKETLPSGYYAILSNIAIAQHYLGDYAYANETFFRVMEEGMNYFPPQTKATLYNNIGLNYKKASNFNEAIIYYEKALGIDDSLQLMDNLALDYTNMGGVYFSWKKYDQALEYYQMSLNIYLKHSYARDISSSLSNMGATYKALKKYDIAKEHYKMALDTATSCNDVFYMGTAFHGLGQVAYLQNDYKAALSYEKQALDLLKETGRSFSMTNANLVLGQTYLALKEFRLAKIYFTAADSLSKELKTLELEKSVVFQFAKYYSITGQNQKSILYYEKFILLNDSLFNQKSHQLLTEYEVKLNNLAKERELEVVSLENEMRKSKIEVKNKLIWVLSSGAFIFMLLGVVLWIMYRQKNASYLLLFNKNKEQLEVERKAAVCRKESLKKMISPEMVDKILHDLYHLMDEEKIFLQQDLTAPKLADILNTNTSYLSKIINDNFGLNYKGFINKYRITEAQNIILQESYKNYTIEAISHECGFNSKSVFNAAFKKITGLTPSYYMQNNSN